MPPVGLTSNHSFAWRCTHFHSDRTRAQREEFFEAAKLVAAVAFILLELLVFSLEYTVSVKVACFFLETLAKNKPNVPAHGEL